MRLQPRLRPRRGSLLVVVLVTIVMLALAAYTFTALMTTEDEAARLIARQVQSKYLVDSGVDYCRLFLATDQATLREKGGLWDNATSFQAVPVGVDPNNPNYVGRFSIISSSLDDEGNPEGYRFGLVDESAKLNLNTLTFADNWVPGGGRQLLMGLPDMTEDIADAILDYIDGDTEAREYGVETSFYEGQSPPYSAKDGPLDSIDELLNVRGVTPQMMFGLDSNRNGLVDPEEMAGENVGSVAPDMLLGWANYLTLHSKESNLNAEKLARVNLNNPDLEQLYTDLRSAFNEEWCKFIIQYRQNGPYTLKEGDADPVPASAPFELDFEVEGSTTFTQILDLVDAYTTAPNPDDADTPLILRSPIRMENLGFSLPTLMKSATTFEGEVIPGRLNVMQAPRRLLSAVPGMTDEILDQIIQKREFELDDPDGADLNRQFETWLLTELLVDLNTMKVMLPFLCTGGDVYMAEVVGYFDDGVGTSRAEVVIDTTVPIPRILFWRDKSHLQSGYSLDLLGTSLKN
ncbi:MAG: general secretion pathway protein GspK [Planctomycetota bacterium]